MNAGSCVDLDDERQLHGRRGHFHGRLGALVKRSIHDVGPMDQFGNRRGIEAKTRLGNVSQEAGARGVVGIEKLVVAAHRVSLAGQKVLVILRRQKGRLVMIEPPGDLGRCRIFKVDDGVFVAGKLVFVEERAGPMHQAVVLIACSSRDALTVKACEQRG